MAGKVLNIKVCNPLKLRSGLTEKKHAICHYSYNLPLYARQEKHTAQTDKRTSIDRFKSIEVIIHYK